MWHAELEGKERLWKAEGGEEEIVGVEGKWVGPVLHFRVTGKRRIVCVSCLGGKICRQSQH